MKKYTYDAFISYSHNEKDAFAAEQLHKTLEHYHIPKRIQQSSGKKKIERVFRDREEMPISFNLASNIQEALDQSEFLILMCSPNSIKSEWVQREVDGWHRPGRLRRRRLHGKRCQTSRWCR